MAGNNKSPTISTMFFSIIFAFAFLPLHKQFFLAENPQISVDTNQRVDCLPSPYFVESRVADCLNVGCIWDENFDKYNPTVPQCFFPVNKGYEVDSMKDGKIKLRWLPNNPLKNAYSPPNLDIEVESKEMGSALAIQIGNKERFSPPVPLNRIAKIESKEKLAFKHSSKGTFTFTVERESDGLKIWDTSIGGFVFGDKFIQIATFLPTDRIYGFGENIHHQLKHDFWSYKNWGMFSRDQPEDAYEPGSVNEYGVHPFYMGLEPSGKAHGVLIFNSNAQEYTTGPAPHLIYRTIGGQLELFFFPGPTPEEVIRQYHQLVGRPYLPAYWSFGFQICRYGYKSLEEVKGVVKRIREAQIPFDVQYADIDYMERYKDFTFDKEKWGNFPEYTKELHSMGMKLILIFDPPVQVNYSAFKNGLEKGASFIEWPSKDMVQNELNDMYEETNGTKIMLGAMWPDYHSAFPDWLDPLENTTEWWIQEFVDFHEKLPFDGLWIDMNEPSVFGTNEAEPWYWKPNSPIPDKPHIKGLRCPANSKLDFPPYQTVNVYQHQKGDKQISLFQNTLCMLAKTGRNKYNFYDTHSLYGWSETVATQKALRKATGNKRGAVISRSTFPSSGKHGGHWLGDNKSTWFDLRWSIIGIQEFNMFGIPHVGSDVCGFELDTNEELCIRWQQLGAFYSYYRNHNNIGRRDQEPTQWPTVAKVTKEANLFRYRHLPHLYSLHFRASMFGGTVVRSMFFEFPLDPMTHSISFQFMWGPAIVVMPVISPNVDTVHGYLPSSAECWYSMSVANNYGAQMPTGYSTFNAPKDTPLPVFLRGGHIIPRQVPSSTTTASRKNPFQLLVGFDLKGVADGELFWDDGDTAFDDIEKDHSFDHFQFHAKSNAKGKTFIRIERKHSSTNLTLPSLNQIELFGHLGKPKMESITLNGANVDLDKERSKFDSSKHLLLIEAKGMINLNGQGPWELSWQNEVGPNPNDRGNGVKGNNGKMMIGMIIAAFCISILFAAIFNF